jgi:ATP-dependent Lon protease
MPDDPIDAGWTTPRSAGGENLMPPAGSLTELSAAELTFTAPPEWLQFRTTADIKGDGDWLGQERALAALELALHVRHGGFNIYVCGLSGTHRDQDLADLLRRFTGDQPTPGDRVLVQNFRNPDRPRALYLPAGTGVRLRQDMRELIHELRQVLPRTLREETFEEEKERLADQFGEQGETINRELAAHAEKAGFILQPGPSGEVLFVPLKDGRPMQPEELAALTEEEQAALRTRQRELGRQVKSVMRRQRGLVGRLAREVKAAERRAAADVLTPLIGELVDSYADPEVRAYLSEVSEHILDNLEDFQEQPATPMPPFMMPWLPKGEEFLDYEVNVLVDSSTSQGAPIVIEPSPMYKNLFGAVERMVDRSGKLVTNFTRVSAGSLLRAHGGCLIMNVIDVLSEPLVWRSLKRTLKTGQLEIETYDPFALFSVAALKPEAMAVDARVVLVGPTDIFQLLYFVDEEFRDIFKVRADFGYEVDGALAHRSFVGQVARIARQEALPSFTAEAVARLMEFAARTVGDRRKLPSQFDDLGDVMREAAFWARKGGRAEVVAADVQQAVEQRRFRLDRIAAKMQEMVRDKVLLVDVDGRRVGQVNGLAVLNLGGYEFGRPSRITAAVSMGTHGVVAVDREAKMSGKTYDKGVLIISGYIRHTYAQDVPLSLSASLSFEQSYSEIDGDSASVAELCALISSLSGVALRQDLAVTGSVNQFGDIQAIGGVNAKVEGFFYTCREVGLTGRQGVVIPAANVTHLMVTREIVEAVSAGRFHVYPVATLNQCLELFTGVRAGDVREPGTIHYLAAQRLRSLSTNLRHFMGGSDSTRQIE